jgi:hypothetical protein
MSLITNQLLINNLGIPKEISLLVKDYVFRRINKIPKSDSRYEMLRKIPKIRHVSGSSYVYLNLTISHDRAYNRYFNDYDTCYIIGISYTTIHMSTLSTYLSNNVLMSVRVNK